MNRTVLGFKSAPLLLELFRSVLVQPLTVSISDGDYCFWKCHVKIQFFPCKESKYFISDFFLQVEIGSAMMRGLARGALGVGIVVDGVTIFFSSRDLASGCSSKFSEALYKLADFKEEELGRVMSRIDQSDLLLEE